MNETVFSVGSLYRRSKNALAREFRGPVWVAGEIKSIRDLRGNWYITLVEPGDFADGTDISLDIACWTKKRYVIESQLGKAGITLAAGMEVRIQGTVTLGKLGKLLVELTALDTGALLGKQLAEKQLLRDALIKEGIAQNNQKLTVPLVPLRIGLVTSEGSDGYRDFMGELQRTGFNFEVRLAHSPVQGPSAPANLARAISSFNTNDVDVIAVVRGGGGELDAFDKEPVVRAIANCSIPVWTGIGHTADRSLSDDIANASFITPTACAQALSGVVGQYMSRVSGAAVHLKRTVVMQLDRSSHGIHQRADRLSRACNHRLELASTRLDTARRDLNRHALLTPDRAHTALIQRANELTNAIQRTAERLQSQLAIHRAKVMSLDPQMPLRRGYSLTYAATGELLRSIEQVPSGEQIITHLADGTLSSTVTDSQARKTEQ